MPPKAAFNSGQKRKDAPASTPDNREQVSKRPRFSHVPKRPDIPTQTSIAGLDSATGALDVAAFVSAREFEIRALENSMQRDRKTLSQRAFQQVPREMRRRGASHNAKKVPKRLHKRATKEMKEDNTPTVNAKTRPKSRLTRIRIEKAKKLVGIHARIRAEERRKKTGKEGVHDPKVMVDLSRASKIKKNSLVDPPKATTKFKKRQAYKTWLPTHLWHAKRAHMTKPTQPLWRMAIPLEPTEKSYRPTHRAGGGRGAIAWDTSYVATIGCSGGGDVLSSMLQQLGFGRESVNDVWSKKDAKWKNGTRAAQSWISDPFANKKPIAPCTVIWCPKSEPKEGNIQDKVKMEGDLRTHPTQRKLFIRIHPSTFLQAWTLILKIVKEKKLAVSVEDLRFEIGSIEITGPASTEALQGVLRPASTDTAAATWLNLSGVTNPSSLPLNSILNFDVLDPRLQNQNVSRLLSGQDANTEIMLAELLATWPPDQSPTLSGLFSNELRYEASRSLPSQKCIDRRRTEAGPGKAPDSKPTDPRIPVILLSRRSSDNTNSNSQGTWTLLLPWKCVDIIWRRLLFCPLSSGGTPRFGGLKQQQQLAFEQQEPWFPGDFPGTDAGKAWNRNEDEIRKTAWQKKPPSRRMNWDAIEPRNGEKGELGSGWSCDWQYLFNGKASPILTDDKKPKSEMIDAAVPSNTDNNQEQKNFDGAFEAFQQMIPKDASPLLTCSVHLNPQVPAGLPRLAAIRLRYLTRGTPHPAARIYCLPSVKDDPHLRNSWLSKADNCKNTKQNVLKDKINHRGDIRKHRVYQNENIDDFNVPGYDPAWDDEKKVNNARSSRRMHQEPNPESRTELAASLLEKGDTQTSDLIPCPAKDNLIGFITSGAYNLAQGRGTAIGSIWVEKILRRWSEDEEAAGDTGMVTGPKQLKTRERERRLVVVRNAGETVGRLAVWEPI